MQRNFRYVQKNVKKGQFDVTTSIFCVAEKSAEVSMLIR